MSNRNNSQEFAIGAIDQAERESLQRESSVPLIEGFANSGCCA